MTNSDALTPDAVLAFLRANPGFLSDEPELAAALVNAPEELGVVSLHRAARVRLDAKLQRCETARRALIATARDNLAVQAQTHAAILALLEADDTLGLDRRLAGRAKAGLGMDALVVLVEGAEVLEGAHALFPAQPGLIDTVMADETARLGPVTTAAEAIFGDAADGLASWALLRIRVGDRPGLFAAGSKDAEALSAEQGTELLTFLAGVTARLLERRPWALAP